MPSLVRPWIVTYRDPAGRKVRKGTPGAKRHRSRSAKWYGQGIPGHPPRKRFPLATDKQIARRMLEDLVRKAERGNTDLPDADTSSKLLADLLAAFQADMALGLASRARSAKRVPSPDQVELTVQRVRDALAGCSFIAPADLDSAAPAKLAKYLRGRIALPRTDGGLSHQTASFVLAAVKRFAWWLSVRAKASVRADLFDDVPGFDPKNERVHARRNCTPEELATILEAALKGKAHRTLSGEDRYFLYLVAFATGFRAAELAALTPAHFELSTDAPCVLLPGKRAKNRKLTRQPLPLAVAVQVERFLAGRPTAQPVWPGKWVVHAAKMLRVDLKAAGIPYKLDTPDGAKYLDFHALRHSFVSALAAAGVGPKELQELARHSDPRLTLGIYSHARPAQLAASVGRLELPGGTVNPLAKLTRGELESLVVSLSATVHVLLGGT